MKKTYEVQGMHCASCAQIIVNKVGALPWVASCEVNFGTKKTTIDYNPQETWFSQMEQEVQKYGYTLIDTTTSSDHSEHQKTPGDIELQKIWNNVLISLPFITISIGIMIWMIGAEYGLRAENMILYEFFHHLLPIFATIMLFVVGWKYIIAVGRYIRYGVANMDTLVGIGTIVAYLYSFVISGFDTSLEPYLNVERWFYEAVIVVIGFIEIWKYMEAKVMSKTGHAIKALLWLQAKNAIILKEGKEIQVSLEHVQLGDIMIVKPWEKIPLDGKIISGKADIDESMITGESMPISKTVGDEVIWSTLVINSTLHVQTTALGQDTFLSKIIAVVEQAQNSKPNIQKLADQIMVYFVPVVLLIAVSAGLFWLFWGNQFFPGINSIEFALMSFVGVLVIACPCGLGLATPMAIITGVGHGARNGILAKNAQGLLELRKTNIVVFDKTGTITEGKPMLVEGTDASQTHMMLLASLEALSSHPIAHAISEYADKHNIILESVSDFENLAGAGIQGTINGKVYAVTKPGWLGEQGISYDTKRIDQRTNQGKTPLILSSGQEVLAYFAVADTIKSTSKQAITDLKKMGITPIMITGDHQNTAQYIAAQIGIDKVYSQVLPADKAALIKSVQWPKTIVTMVGDGINDAPALAQADIGIAMSTGTDVAIESADITLLHGDLSKLVKAIRISKLTQSAILQNLAWAFGFNILGIPLAAGAFYPFLGVLLNPAFEWAAMAFSDLTVVGNSLRLQNKKLF